MPSLSRCSFFTIALVASLLVLTPAVLLRPADSAEPPLAAVLDAAPPTAPAARPSQPAAKGTVLVTGANRGIGLALATAFKGAGYEVIGTARSPEEARELAALGARVIALDVTSAESVKVMSAALAGKPIDILINNAGVSSRGEKIESIDFEAVERTLRVNTVGPMRVTQALLPNLRAGSKKIVASISSRLASLDLNTTGGYYGYRESKSALNMFMRSLAVELRPEGFTCVALSPGWVRTDMGGSQAPLSPEESAAGLLKVIEALTNNASGTFVSYDGAPLAW